MDQYIDDGAANYSDDRWSTECLQVLWREAQTQPGTLVREYLGVHRGLDVSLIGFDELRTSFHQSSMSAAKYPALIFPGVSDDGQLQCIQAIRFQLNEIKQSPPVVRRLPNSSKITNGSPKGAPVRFAKLEGVDETVLIVEGPEDGLTARQVTGQETWAALSLQNIGSLPVQKGKRYIVIADGGSEKQTLVQCQILASAGADILIADPPAGFKDANEALIADRPELITEAINNARPVLPSVLGYKWPKPDLSLLNGNRREPPELDLRVFGTWEPWLEKASQAFGCPIDYTALTLLTISGSLIAGSRWAYPFPNWPNPPIIWGALLGDPSQNKSVPGRNLYPVIKRLSREFDKEYEAQNAEFLENEIAAKASQQEWQRTLKEAAKKDMQPPSMPVACKISEPPYRVRLMIDDSTTERLVKTLSRQDRAVLLKRDELAGWLKSFDRYSSGGDRQFWIEAYDGGSFTVDRIKHGEDSISADRLMIAILGSIQPERFAQTLLKSEDDGLLSRLFVVWPNKIPPILRPPEADLELFETAMGHLLALKPSQDELGENYPKKICLFDDALLMFDEVRTQIANDESQYDGFMRSFAGKMPGAVMRVALILVYLDWAYAGKGQSPNKIERDHVIRAATYCLNYLMPMAERAYGDATIPLPEQLAGHLARWITGDKKQEISVREIQQYKKRSGMRTAEEIRNVLQVLEEAGWVRRSIPTKPKSGPAAEVWQVNPTVFEE